MAVLFGLVDAGQPRKLELRRPGFPVHRNDLALHQLAGEDLAGSQNAGIARRRQRDRKITMHRHGRGGAALALFGCDLDHHYLQGSLQVRGSKAGGIAEPQLREVQDVEHQPRLGAERPARAILRHVFLCPRNPAAALARGSRFTALEPDGRIVVWLDMLLVDHPADQVAEPGQQIAGLNRCASLQLFAQHPPRQRRKRSLAVVEEQGLDQPGPRVSRAFGQPFLTNREIAEPAIALPEECPVPTKATRNRWRCGQRLALFAPLLLGADPVSGVAEFADLVDDRSINRAIELVAPELLLNSDLRQLVAQLHLPTQLTLVGDIIDQVAAGHNGRLIGPGAAHAWHSSQGTDRCLPRLMEVASLIQYNREDCEALRSVCEFLIEAQECKADGQSTSRPPVTSVAQLDKLARTVTWSKFQDSNFEFVNKRAYFDYQRRHVFVRSKPSRRKRVTNSGRRRWQNRSLRVTHRVEITATRCPACKSKRIVPLDPKHRPKGVQTRRKRAFDLIVTPAAIRRKVIEFRATPPRPRGSMTNSARRGARSYHEAFFYF